MKSNGFSALSQSLAILGEDIHSGAAPVTKPRKKNHKKKNNRSKANAEPDSAQITATSETDADDYDGWISVISKKKKLNVNGISNGTISSMSDNGVKKRNSPPKTEKMPIPSLSNEKKKGNTGAKKPKQSEGPETSVNKTSEKEALASSKTSPVNQSQPVQRQHSETKVSTPVKNLADPSPLSVPAPMSSTSPQLEQHQHQQVLQIKANDANAPGLNEIICFYVRQLEFMLVEKTGSESVIKARSSYPDLKFSLPPPSVSSATTESSSNSDVISKTELALLKADLLAMEGEVKVLMEALKRSQHQTNLPPPPLISIEEKKHEPEKLAKKLKTASKYVQCDTSTFPESQPIVNHQQQQNSTSSLPPSIPAVPSANELTFIKSLQDEIASLSRENIILKQRCNNANSRLEVLNQKYSKLQSETKKMSVMAAKEAEARIRQETEALVKKLQDEVSERATQVVTNSAQIESLQKKLADSQSKVDQLIKYEQASEARVSECEKMVSDLKARNDKLTQEKNDLNKNVMEVNTKMTYLNHSLAEREAEMARVEEECNRLKDDLKKSNFELLASKQAIAEMTTNESALKAALVEVELLKEECSRLRDDLEKSHCELTGSKQAIADLMASESALKAVVAEKNNILAQVECLKDELSANKSVLSNRHPKRPDAMTGLSVRQSELEDFKEAWAVMGSESAQIKADLTKITEQWKLRDVNGGSKAAGFVCCHCFELTEELSRLRSTLSKADQDLRRLQRSLDCEENSRAESGDTNGCLENGDYDPEDDY